MFGFSRKGASKGSYHNIGLEGTKSTVFVQNSKGNEERYITLEEGPRCTIFLNSETPRPTGGELKGELLQELQVTS